MNNSISGMMARPERTPEEKARLFSIYQQEIERLQREKEQPQNGGGLHTQPDTVPEQSQTAEPDTMPKTVSAEKADTVPEQVNFYRLPNTITGEKMPYCKMPYVILYSKLSDAEFRVYSALLKYHTLQGGIIVSAATIADEIGKDERNVRKAIKSMCSKGFIKIEQIANSKKRKITLFYAENPDEIAHHDREKESKTENPDEIAHHDNIIRTKSPTTSGRNRPDNPDEIAHIIRMNSKNEIINNTSSSPAGESIQENTENTDKQANEILQLFPPYKRKDKIACINAIKTELEYYTFEELRDLTEKAIENYLPDRLQYLPQADAFFKNQVYEWKKPQAKRPYNYKDPSTWKPRDDSSYSYTSKLG